MQIKIYLHDIYIKMPQKKFVLITLVLWKKIVSRLFDVKFNGKQRKIKIKLKFIDKMRNELITALILRFLS